MTPESVVTIGMISTFISVIVGCWQVFRYIGKLEYQIKENESNLTNTANSLRERDRRLLREINRRSLAVKDVEFFLSEKFKYNSRPSIEMEETDF